MRYPFSPSPRQGDSASSKPIASLILKRAPIGPNPDEIICVANLSERCHRLLASALWASGSKEEDAAGDLAVFEHVERSIERCSRSVTEFSLGKGRTSGAAKSTIW
jgi:hypothetical protein